MADDMEKNRQQSGQTSGQQQTGQHGHQQSGQPGQRTPLDSTKKDPSQGGPDADDEQENQRGQRRAS